MLKKSLKRYLYFNQKQIFRVIWEGGKMKWKLLQQNIFAQTQFKFVTSFNSITISIMLKPQKHRYFFFLGTSEKSGGSRQQHC